MGFASADVPATYTIAVTLIDPCSPILSYVLLLLFRERFQQFMSLNIRSLLVSLLVTEKQKQLLVFVLFLFLCLCIYFCSCWKSFWRHCGVVQRLLLRSCDGDWQRCPQAQASPQINSGQETILSIPKVGLQDWAEFPHERPFYPLCPNLSAGIKLGKIRFWLRLHSNLCTTA